MILKKLTGEQFKEITKFGALNLRANYEEVDSLNVFPVPDGDTGTNMCRTIENGVLAVENLKDTSLSSVCKELSKGMLMGARGNSGVILSQIYRGICKGLSNYNEVNAIQLGEAFKVGVKQAYGAVVTPVEGTILTVFREATEYACENIEEDSTINEFFELHLKQSLITLKKTKELLPVLKEANVIDSGGCGYTYIVKGIVKYLDGEKIEGAILASTEENKNESEAPLDFSAFTSDDVLQFGYCTEFILRLQKSKVDVETFDENTIVDYLQNSEVHGDSIVCLKDEDVIKTHVHTKNPGLVLTKMREYGEFLTIKIENMALQHNEIMSEEEKEEKMPHKKYAVVAVCNGEGLTAQFKEFGVDGIVNGNNTMNPSTEDFIRTFKKIDAEHIFVFPNNKNIIMAARQAAKLYKGAEVHVIESKSIPQCYSALTMLDFSSDDVEIIMGNIKESIHNVVTCEVTYSIRNCTLNKVIIHKGDMMGIVDGKIVYSMKDRVKIIDHMFKRIPDIKNKQVVTMIYGADVTEKEKAKVTKLIEEKYPYLEVGAIDGGQSVYNYWIAVE